MQGLTEGLTVLSLFDGISGGHLALDKAGIKVKRYFASEVDENAIKVTQTNYPSTVQLGDVTKVSYKEGILYSENGSFDVGTIDLVIGGSPCQGFSFNGKQLNFDDPRSKLFFEYERLIHEIEPVYFLLENVKMRKESEKVITESLGVEPVLIDSALLSAQTRKRLYWTNIDYEQSITDKGILIKDILDDVHGEEVYDYIPQSNLNNIEYKANYMQYDINGRGNGSQDQRAFYLEGKCGTLNTACGWHSKFLLADGRVRRLTHNEIERLQTVPDGYTKILPRSKASKAIGNGWTVDIIAHIFSGLSKGENFK